MPSTLGTWLAIRVDSMTQFVSQVAPSSNETACSQRSEPAVADRRGPPDPPETGRGLEEAQREAFEAGPAGKVGCAVGVDVPGAADDRARVGLRVELDPLGVAFDKRIDALPVRDPPPAE